MKTFDQLSPWEMLGLAPGATAEEIRRAYERVSSRLAPGSLALYSIANTDEQADVQQRLRAAYVELLAAVGPGEPPADARPPKLRPTANPNDAEVRVSAPPADRPTSTESSVAVPGPEFNGDLLRRSREARGLSLDGVSHRTRIRRQLLEALEGERFDQLPERVFVRGFVLAVARELGLDPERVWAGYGKRWEAWAASRG